MPHRLVHLTLTCFWRSAHKTDLRIAQGGTRATCLCKMLIGLHSQRKKKNEIFGHVSVAVLYEPAIYVIREAGG